MTMSDYNTNMNREDKIIKVLKSEYPNADCALRHDSAWQLLLATILSAQCTDARVNIATKELFKDHPTVNDIQKLSIEALEKYIHSTGFYRNKARNIKKAAEQIIQIHGGQVPDTLHELVKLSGVGRKTANVVLSIWYKKNQGIVVDTHVKRISARLGLSKQNDPVKIEAELMKLIPQKDWERYSTLLIHHGRKICTARNPRCNACPLANNCPSANIL
ncbi:endonuclease III [Candidatus Dojkabacteria bacterium]|uniref:Endonuclease III n=1 Tax=Candidatus Dojkabacteria bacterium TaxID=2099670 RepID=A0A952AJM9_9BACT|nr:endonuclease III [Candidatus Dojkabacteria bacterium]